MTISSIDGVIAGNLPPLEFRKYRNTNWEISGQMSSLAYEPGIPGAAVAPAPGIAGAALTSYAGQLPFTNPSGGNSCYLAGFELDANTTGTVILYDRLWHNSGIVVTQTTLQAVNSVAWPARDRNASTNGEGIVVGIEVSTATTNGALVTTITMLYTNSAGANNRTATIPSFPATAVAGTFVPFSLQAGDTGIQSIQSITLGTSLGAGAVHLVAYRVLSKLPTAVINTESSRDASTGCFPQLFADTVPFLLVLPLDAAAPLIYDGIVTYAEG